MKRSIISEPSSLKGQIEIPGDKSVSHRALICGALASSPTKISNLQRSEDVLNTFKVIKNLGIDTEQKDLTIRLYGKGLRGLSKPSNELYFGNSGTGIRLMTGALSGQNFDSILQGDSSLTKRPMKRISEPLEEMGACINLSSEFTPPIEIIGNKNLSAISYDMPIPSAQVKSAILFAALFSEGKTKVRESLVSRNHTELMFQQFGINLKTINSEITLSGQEEFEGKDINVPGDFSSAAFMIVGALITPDSSILIKDVGLNSTRIALLEVLNSMEADIKIENIRKFGSEEVGDLRVSSSQLKPCKVGASLIPNLIDELPILFIASLFATGDSEFFGIEELRHKESDRLLAMQSGLKNIEIETIYNSGKLTIEGKGSDYLIDSGTVDSFEDHRIAMAFIIAGLRSKKNLVVKNTNCIKTSFPEFSYLLDSLGAKIDEIQ
ncbi:3-phosphoshikimate 1-carboxyvinyltransferase [SAR86 cluster bacterium]|nr:3-phosphoshikimate 1-carboxyvinyltransferase [SAR86 cluster bacterium]